jgi:hypothetical protein
MERFTITSDEAEQLLNGRAFERDDLFELRDFVRTAASMTRAQPTPQTEQRHLAAIAEARHLEPLTTDAPRTRSKTMARSIIRSKAFKTLAGAVAAVVAMGGLAAAQTLPAPAQDAMAEVAERVGITLPHSRDAKVKTGGDHDGDGVADDNGLHTGQTGEKRGADHDGDGVADDNGLHKGQNQEKRGADHDGDGVADDNGLHKGDGKAGGGDEGEAGGGDEGDAGDDHKNEHASEGAGNASDKAGENRGHGQGTDNAPDHD